MVMRKKVLALGGNFGGLTAALSVKHELEGDVDVTVVSASDRFLFNPSLIWLPFGKRRPADITFPLAQTFESHDVDFVHASATRIDPVAQQVETTRGSYGYDDLLISTGNRLLADGRSLEFAYAMIVPPFLGQEVVRTVDGVADDKGYVPVHDTYQSVAYPNVYAVGIAAAVTVPWTTAVPVGIPKTGF